MMRKVGHKELVESFVSRIDAAITTARGNGEHCVYCHIPDDVLEDVRRTCSYRFVDITPSHRTDDQTFYKVSGWKEL